MLARSFIRENPDLVREAIRKKRSTLALDDLLALDQRVLDAQSRVDSLRAEQNRISKQVPKAAPEARQGLIAEGRVLGDEISRLENELRPNEERLHELLLRVPNIP